MAPINNPNGNEVSEIVLPDGATASEVIAPDGSTVFGSAIPDSVVNNMDTFYAISEGSGTAVGDGIDNEPATTDASWLNNTQYYEDFALDFTPADNERMRSDNQVDLNGDAQSVAGWVTLDAINGNDVLYYMGDQTDGSESRDDGWYVRVGSASSIEILDGVLGGAGAEVPLSVNPDPDLSTGSQYFIAATCERSNSTDTYNLFVYDNSSLIGSGSTTNSNRATTAATYLYGMREPKQVTSDGKLDFVMFNESAAVSKSAFDQIHTDSKSGR